MKTNYNRTVQACFIGYVVQAIVNNFVPLLFLTFQGSYGISLQKIITAMRSPKNGSPRHSGNTVSKIRPAAAIACARIIDAR